MADSDPLDLRATVVPLYPAAVGVNDYTVHHRYAEFRKVLIHGEATPEQCQRVLYQILDLCRINVPIADLNNPHATYLAAGRQEVGLILLRWLTQEPEHDG